MAKNKFKHFNPKEEILKEWLHWFDYEFNWTDMKEYHNKVDNKRNEIVERLEQLKKEGR